MAFEQKDNLNYMILNINNDDYEIHKNKKCYNILDINELPNNIHPDIVGCRCSIFTTVIKLQIVDCKRYDCHECDGELSTARSFNSILWEGKKMCKSCLDSFISKSSIVCFPRENKHGKILITKNSITTKMIEHVFVDINNYFGIIPDNLRHLDIFDRKNNNSLHHINYPMEGIKIIQAFDNKKISSVGKQSYAILYLQYVIDKKSPPITSLIRKCLTVVKNKICKYENNPNNLKLEEIQSYKKLIFNFKHY